MHRMPPGFATTFQRESAGSRGRRARGMGFGARLGTGIGLRVGMELARDASPRPAW